MVVEVATENTQGGVLLLKKKNETSRNKSTYSTVITRLLFNYKYLLSIKVNVQIFRIQAVGNYWET